MQPTYFSGIGKMTLAMAAVILNWQYVLSLYILWSQGTDTSSHAHPYLVVLAFVVNQTYTQ